MAPARIAVSDDTALPSSAGTTRRSPEPNDIPTAHPHLKITRRAGRYHPITDLPLERLLQIGTNLAEPGRRTEIADTRIAKVIGGLLAAMAEYEPASHH